MNWLWSQCLRFSCWMAGHPRESRRIFYLGAKGGVRERDEWRECVCGRHASAIKRTRIQQPYEHPVDTLLKDLGHPVEPYQKRKP